MYKKVALVFSCFLLIGNAALAQNSPFCKAANDSMAAQFKRGEMGCFVTSKGPGGAITHIKIYETHYEKISVKYGAKDSTFQKKLEAMKEKGIKMKESPLEAKNQGKDKDSKKEEQKKEELKEFSNQVKPESPNDTSTEFKKCYNQAFQSKLDSAFKCDFFRKSDSIMKSYDKKGKGYKNVDFVGGAGALQKFMDKNVSLPKDVKANDSDKVIRVYYSFMVDEKGAVSDVKLSKSNCKECEDPVLAALKKLPPFIPATEAGKPKKVKYILPFTKKI